MRLSTSVSWPAREGDDVSNVLHASAEKDQALEAETEAGVNARAKLSQVRVPLVDLGVKIELLKAADEDFIPLLTLRAPDELPDTWHKNVHGGNSLPVLVSPHVECLDRLGIVVTANWLLEDFLRDVSLMLRSHVHSPLDLIVLKLVSICYSFLQDLDRLCIATSSKRLRGYCANSVDASLVVHLGEKDEVIHALLEHTNAAVANVVLGALHNVEEVGEGDLGLDHPELSKVARGVAVLSSERGPEGVD
mmetsp:Transcript_8995/g.29990  ORF Transcript_8995/g.29990 Transcript_8995/m.29990 type:complete len:249 (-) Transcript_8995:2433-3179(-)